MELIYRITLFIAGLINLIPTILAFIPDKIAKSYGIEVPNVNYELVLRHRAVLLGLVGAFMIYSAFTKKYYEASTIMGFISMIAFIVLFYLIGNINPELKKVMIIDVVATIILTIGVIAYLISIGNIKN